MQRWTIGQLAKRARVNVETVRYYERRGLLPTPRRTESGYRQYSQDMAVRIRFIKRAQELGFSLSEILELLALEAGPDSDCADVKKRAEDKLADIENKIQDLQRMQKALTPLVAACAGHGPASQCSILESLATSEDELR